MCSLKPPRHIPTLPRPEKPIGKIAQLLGIKPVTAHYHVERAKAKFGVKTRVEAVAAAVLSGLV